MAACGTAPGQPSNNDFALSSGPAERFGFGIRRRPPRIRRTLQQRRPAYTVAVGKIALADFFGNGFGLEVVEQVVFAAGFGVCAGHVEATEGVGADHGAGAFTIQI